MIPDIATSLREFFESYEKAIQPDSGANLRDFYHDPFLFAGESGARAVQLDDFIKIVPAMSADAKSRGLISTKLRVLDAEPLDSKYSLAKVVWDVVVESQGKAPRHIETKATYLMMRTANTLRIVGQVDHQNLALMMQSDTIVER
jgi:hypothetical protein